MATSPVQICNLALSRIGQKPIMSLDDTTVAAALCRENYDPARQATLCAFEWTFAQKRASLPALATPPTWGYAKAYEVPSDCLKVNETDVDEEQTPWQVEGQTIVTDATAPLKIRYTLDETDVTKFSAAFVDAFADQLAAEIVFAITKHIGYRDGFYKSSLMKAQNARSTDSRQGTATLPDSDLLTRVR